MKIRTKILSVILCITIFSQLILAVISYVSFVNLSNYSTDLLSNVINKVSDDSQTIIKGGVELYSQVLSEYNSENTYKFFTSVEDDISFISNNLENDYKNNFTTGSVPVSTDDIKNSYSGEKKDIFPSAFVVDHILNDGKVSVYDPKFYPQSIKNELLILNSSFDIMKIGFLNCYAGGGVYIGTNSKIFYQCYDNVYDKKFDPTTRSWYTSAVENYQKTGEKNLIWNITYDPVNDEKDLFFTCSKVYTDSNGNELGVIAMDLSLIDFMSSKIGYTGYLFLLENNSNKIYRLIENENIISVNQIDENNIDETYKDLLDNMKLGNKGNTKIIIDDKEYLAYYSPFKLPALSNYSSAVVNETSELFNPVYKMQDDARETLTQSQIDMKNTIHTLLLRFIIIFVIFLIIVIVVSIFLSNKIVNPIIKLKSSVEIIGTGNLTAKVEKTTKDEIGDLADAFNYMTDQLKIYIKDLAKTISEKEKIHSELNVAKGIQSSMLPSIFPPFPNRNDLDIYATMNPAKEVGGDFYDFFFIDESHFAIVIADVSDKGVAAALFMVISKTLIKNQALPGRSTSEILELVNNQLCENNKKGMFVTAFMGIVDINTGEFMYSNAGHNKPLLYRKKQNNFEWLNTRRGLVLAGLENQKYKTDKVKLEKGDMLYLYTDGITEALNTERKLFSSERLIKILNNEKVSDMDIKDIIKYIDNKVNEFSNGAKQADDITMLIFKNICIGENDKKEYNDNKL